MIARGYHREAAFWLVVTGSRALQKLAHGMGPEAAASWEGGYAELLADLGVASFAAMCERRDRALDLLPKCGVPPPRSSMPRRRSLMPDPDSGASDDARFWALADQLVREHRIVIDRPGGSRHPRYPAVVYPFDYGYLEGTGAIDGDGVDCWRGSLGSSAVTGAIVTVDVYKADSEVKWLVGCTAAEMTAALATHRTAHQAASLMPRPAGMNRQMSERVGKATRLARKHGYRLRSIWTMLAGFANPLQTVRIFTGLAAARAREQGPGQ